MTKKLFIMCPFSKMEPFIRKHFGELIYCMTIPGVDFFHDTELKLEQILHFVEQEEITEIVVVNDLDCPYLTGIIKNKPMTGWNFEVIMQDIFLSQYHSFFKGKSKLMQQIKLSELYVLCQAKRLSEQLSIKKEMVSKIPNINALMCYKEQDLLKELLVKQYRYEY